MVTVQAGDLKQLSRAIFEAAGANEEEASLVAEFLVRSNLAGHDSHGVIRIPQYVRLMKEGKIRPGTEVEIVRETAATALVDGHWGFGQVVAKRSMEVAVGKAKQTGIGAVGVYDCNHVGRLIDYTAMAADQDKVGVMTVNGYPNTAPFGGVDRMLGAGPISVAIPTGTKKPILLDFSTSVAAQGKVMVKAARGEKVPLGWIVDKQGRPTQNPTDLADGGAMMPFGGDVGYKGFGLGLFVDIMSGALTGSGCASSPEFRGGNGAFMMAVNVSSFIRLDDFKRRVDELIVRVKGSRRAPGVGEVLIPGEPELCEERRRLAEGIHVEEETWKQIASIATDLSLEASLFSTAGY